MILYILILGIIKFELTISGPCASNDKTAEFPSKETEYDVRPNLFIDKDNLLGQNSGHHKTHGHTFGYGTGSFGPSHWGKSFPKCGGKSQSPIDIDLPSLKRINYPNLKWNDAYEKIPEKMTLTNTGHTIQLQTYYENNVIPTIEGGPLHKSYILQNIHFHWGSSDHKGSEHTINRKTFPLEMHVVHSRKDLNFTSAQVANNGLVVVGYIFEIENKCNPALANILNVIDKLKMEHDVPEELTNLFTLDKLLDTFNKEYVTYNGSLTTPPCYETVTWIISPYTINISKQQLEKFRCLYSSTKGLVDNFRPSQPLNNRNVYFVH